MWEGPMREEPDARSPMREGHDFSRAVKG